jgi:hypothetical protein
MPWKSENTTSCGNAECTDIKGINELLKNCGTKEISKVKVPVIRVCPN